MRICRWCGIRVRLFRRYCKPCRLRMQDCGIYLQCGGPAFPYMSRLPEADS